MDLEEGIVQVSQVAPDQPSLSAPNTAESEDLANDSTKKVPQDMRETRRKNKRTQIIINRAKRSSETSKKEKVEDVEREDKSKGEKTYADLVRSIQQLKRFDWIDPTNAQIKLAPIKLMTPSVFWFIECADYFPRLLSIALDASSVLRDVIQKIERQPVQQLIRIKEMGNTNNKLDNSDDLDEIEKITNAIRSLRFEKPQPNIRNSAELKEDYSIEDDLYIMSVRHDLIDLYSKLNQDRTSPVETEKALRQMKRIDLDDLIQAFQFELAEQNGSIKESIDRIKQNIEVEVQEERRIFSPSDLNFQDALVDIHYFNSTELEYLNFLENQQQCLDLLALSDPSSQTVAVPTTSVAHSKQIVKPKEPIIMEDLACQVCNDGDYTDDDLIVFCAKCNVSVHQRCYGIPKIPVDDWVCELCLTFGPEGRYLRCVLCTQRGGAMKPSRIPITSNQLSSINPHYAEFATTCSGSVVGKAMNKKQRYCENNEKVEQQLQAERDINDNDQTDEDSQYYDFHTLKPFEDDELKSEPQPHFVWAHICCALWTPECFFDDRNYYTNVKGIENIDKQRWKLTCSICKTRNGSCIQCAKSKCMEAFHPECARRASRFMEIRNSDKLVYLIYCEGHTPLKLRRQLEQKEKKYKEEIIKFCRSIDKAREVMKKDLVKAAGGANSQLNTAGSKIVNDQGNKFLKKTHTSAKKICMQITKTEEMIRKEERDFQLAFIGKLIHYIESQNSSNQDVAEKSEKEKNKESKQSLFKVNTWTALLVKEKENPFWADFANSISSTTETANSVHKRFRKIVRELDKKKEFRSLYFKTLLQERNIRQVTKEEKQRDKDKKKMEKQQQKLHEIFKKTQSKQNKQSISSKSGQKEGKGKRRTKANIDYAEEDEDYNYEEQEEQDTKEYCICKRRYREGDLMMACEKCDEWYHLECIGFLGTMDDAESLDFVCKFCDIAEGNEVFSKERKDRYGSLFNRFEDPNYDAFKIVVLPQQVKTPKKYKKTAEKVKKTESKGKKRTAEEAFDISKVEGSLKKKIFSDEQQPIGLQFVDLEENAAVHLTVDGNKEHESLQLNHTTLNGLVVDSFDHNRFTSQNQDVFHIDRDLFLQNQQEQQENQYGGGDDSDDDGDDDDDPQLILEFPDRGPYDDLEEDYDDSSKSSLSNNDEKICLGATDQVPMGVMTQQMGSSTTLVSQGIGFTSSSPTSVKTDALKNGDTEKMKARPSIGDIFEKKIVPF